MSKSPSKKIAGNIDDALESVEDIIGAVLAISRLDSGALVPNVTSFPVARMFNKLELEFLPIAEAKGLTLNVISNEFNVESDYSLLRRLLQNLVSNAIKYTKTGTITVDAKIKRNKIVFTVKDTGVGIKKADQKIVFEEFRRLEEGKRAAPGLGLGLSIVQRLAATLEHSIELKTSPGKGSTFSVAAPLSLANDALSIVARDIPIPKLDLSGLIVLCIDNEPRILEGMKSLLGGWGCIVHTFETSDELQMWLSKAGSNSRKTPDIIVADYHLDSENGLDVIQSVRDQLGGGFPGGADYC